MTAPEQLRAIGVASGDPERIIDFTDRMHALGSSIELVEDGEGKPVAAVAHRRGAHPPIWLAQSPDQVTCVFDGELFGLSGSEVDLSDPASLILDRYQAEGTAPLGQMDANAAVVLIDGPARRMILARDPLGNGSLFYSVHRESLYWSSSLSPLRELLGADRINIDGLDYYLSTGYVPSPWTLLANIMRLGPGELIEWRGVPHGPRRYFHLRPEPPDVDGRTSLELLSAELPRAVSRRVKDPDRTGILLSGGVDSMLLLAVATQQCGTAPRSFTFRYERYEGGLNESPRATRCAAHVGSQHQEIPVDPLAIPDRLPQLLEVFGEPFSLGLHTAMMAPVAETGVTDLLTGSGADSGCLDGQGVNAVRFARLPRVAQAAIATASRTGRFLNDRSRARDGRPLPAIGSLLAAVENGVWSARTGLPWIVTEWVIPSALRRRIYHDPASADGALAARRELLRRGSDDDPGLPLELRMAISDSRYFDSDLMQMWNLHSGRAHGLAVRTPFLSFPLLPSRLGLDVVAGTKEATRRLAATLLPADLAQAPKNYQAIPIAEWTRGPLLPFVKECLSPTTLGRTGLFDTRFVGQLLAAHVRGTVDLGWALWMLAQTSFWLERVAARPP